MKLTTEKTLELMPTMIDIYDKLDMGEYIKKVRKENKGITNEKAAEKALKYIGRNTPKIIPEVIEVVAAVQGDSSDEVKKQSPIKTIKVFMDLLHDPEVSGFFDSATE